MLFSGSPSPRLLCHARLCYGTRWYSMLRNGTVSCNDIAMLSCHTVCFVDAIQRYATLGQGLSLLCIGMLQWYAKLSYDALWSIIDLFYHMVSYGVPCDCIVRFVRWWARLADASPCYAMVWYLLHNANIEYAWLVSLNLF